MASAYPPRAVAASCSRLSNSRQLGKMTAGTFGGLEPPDGSSVVGLALSFYNFVPNIAKTKISVATGDEPASAGPFIMLGNRHLQSKLDKITLPCDPSVMEAERVSDLCPPPKSLSHSYCSPDA